MPGVARLVCPNRTRALRPRRTMRPGRAVGTGRSAAPPRRTPPGRPIRTSPASSTPVPAILTSSRTSPVPSRTVSLRSPSETKRTPLAAAKSDCGVQRGIDRAPFVDVELWTGDCRDASGRPAELSSRRTSLCDPCPSPVVRCRCPRESRTRIWLLPRSATTTSPDAPKRPRGWLARKPIPSSSIWKCRRPPNATARRA